MNFIAATVLGGTALCVCHDRLREAKATAVKASGPALQNEAADGEGAWVRDSRGTSAWRIASREFAR